MANKTIIKAFTDKAGPSIGVEDLTMTGDLTVTGDAYITQEVGVNTLTPVSPLHVHQPSSSGITLTREGQGASGTVMELSGDAFFINNKENSTVNFWTNNTAAMSIDASQQVGIGTSGPSTKLHVVDTGDAQVRLAGGASSNPAYSWYQNTTRVGQLTYIDSSSIMRLLVGSTDVIDFGETTIDAKIGLTLPTSGGTASTLDFYESHTTAADNFTISGFQTNENISFHFVRVGRMVTVTNSGASTNTTDDVSATGTLTWDTLIPAQFRPASNTHVAISRLTVGGVGGQSGHVALFSNGNMIFSLQTTQKWASSSSNGIQNKMSFSYTV